MTDRQADIDPTTYVRAAYFLERDDAALFGALTAVNRTVQLVIIEDPENPLLRQHAEILADEVIEASKTMPQVLPGSKLEHTVDSLFGGGSVREMLIESELANLRAALDGSGVGVFAVYGAETDVNAFLAAHLQQRG